MNEQQTQAAVTSAIDAAANIDLSVVAVDGAAIIKAARVVAEAAAEKAASKSWYQTTPAKIGGGLLLAGAIGAAGYYGYQYFTKAVTAA